MGREPLSELRVVNQCHVPWNGMSGTDEVRHCSQCQKNVFNISGMTHAEAVELIRETEGKICVRYYQRKDGTILTRDCSLKDRVSLKSRLALVAVAAALGITMSGGCNTYSSTGDTAGPDYHPSANTSNEVIGKVATVEPSAAQHEKTTKKTAPKDTEPPKAPTPKGSHD